MEVRSNNEKCGNDAVAMATTTTINPKSMDLMASDGGYNVGLITKCSTQPLTKDEKLMAELKTQIPDVDNIFHIHRRIGEGTFSTVFLTSLRSQDHTPMHKRRLFALKYLIPTSHPKRIARELKCLKEIGGKENVVGVDLCLRNNDSIAFVMPYIPHDRFHDYFDKLSVKELQEYMRNLLIALKHVHDFNVIHRDVKPSNFLHDRLSNRYLLVDFGLAQELEPATELNNDINKGQSLSISNNNKTKPSDESVECDKKVAPATATTGAKAEASNEQNLSYEPMEDDDNCDQITDDLNGRSNKRRPSNSDETENKCSSLDAMNPSKRQRTTNEMNATANVIQNANNSNNINNHNIITSTSQHSTSYIPSQYKTPLKQMNEISMKKLSNTELNTPLSADIKSAILGYSFHSKLRISDNTSTPQRITPPNHKYKLNNRLSGTNGTAKCYCYGRPTVCNICLVKREIQATRAGTPGYRPTEVLLKYPNQTTAVDIWAAGVILISILSGCYPFFKSTDDFTALAEIITVFGDEIVKKTAFELGRHVCVSHKKRPLNLRKLCIRLRNRSNLFMHMTQSMDNNMKSMEYCANCEQMDINCLCQHTDFNMDFANDIYPDSVYDLLYKLLAINPFKRITANDALQHPFFNEVY